jgi:signal transduction histidine kinase
VLKSFKPRAIVATPYRLNRLLKSLTGRITLVTAFGLIASGATTVLSVLWIFEATLDEQLDNHLAAYNDVIVAAIAEKEGQLSLENDHGFLAAIPRYWQVNLPHGEVAKSEALLSDIPLSQAESAERSTFVDEDGKALVIYQQGFTFPGDRKVTISFGLEQEIAETYKAQLRRSFRENLLIALGLMLSILLVAGVLIVVIVRKPLRSVGKALSDVQSAETTRIEGEYPSEIADLSNQINRLLEVNEASIARQREFSANVAHALKTPLTVIRNDDSSLLTKQRVDELLQLVDRSLARAKADGMNSSFTGQIEIYPIMARIVEGYRRLYDLRIELQESDRSKAAINEADLFEVIGNLVENACKFGKSKVLLSVNNGVVLIEDDGDGVEPENYTDILHRSVRLDERVPGSGLGLSVTKEIIAAYGGQIDFERSAFGGLKVIVSFGPMA